MCLKLFPLIAGTILTFAGSGICEDALAINPRVIIEPRGQKRIIAPEFAGRANIRVQSTLVLIPVTVTDPLNRFVTGLEREDFKLFEENEAQEIASFSSEDTPVSVGVVFDCSGSMGDKLKKSREALAQVLKQANPEDEFFVVQFNDGANLVQPFTTRTEEVQNRLTFSQSKGRTALLDAIYRAVFETNRARNPRKALPTSRPKSEWNSAINIFWVTRPTIRGTTASTAAS